MFSNLLLQVSVVGADSATVANSLTNILGVNLFEESIDNVVFQTNQFVSDATFIGTNGPFWWILQMCMGLGALFSIIVAANMAYKMMLKGEAFDPMKIIRILGIAMVMFWWYPNINPLKSDWCVLDFLSYIPNAIGSYTHELYEIEASQVSDKYNQVTKLMKDENDKVVNTTSSVATAADNTSTQTIKAKYSDTDVGNLLSGLGVGDVTIDPSAIHAQTSTDAAIQGKKAQINITWAGITLNLDKLLVFLAVLLFRIGWWGTIYCQQIILGMLTIFGPLQWAFSVLPKWEGAWAKWLIRYLTVHFYGAMLYFVGFYILLLFDIVLSIQIEDLKSIVDSAAGASAYLHNGMLTAGYLVVASVVALKCLNLVPDLATWMIPEGEASFSTRNFGEGVAQSVSQKTTGVLRGGGKIL